MSEQWQMRRQTFDSVADSYDQIRPGYPEQLFQDVIDDANIHAGSRVLEIGCGTGQATLPFAKLGCEMTCLEPGAQLATFTRRKFTHYPQLRVQEMRFEAFESQERFDLIFSATAFHWVDPETRFQKVVSLLKPRGTLAVWWNTHVHTDASQDFFEMVQAVYKQTAPAMAAEYHGLLRPDQIDQAYGKEFANATQFGPLTKQLYPWSQRYTADEYTQLLGTYSDHLCLPAPQRALLFERITALINERYGGFITKGYVALLYLGHVK